MTAIVASVLVGCSPGRSTGDGDPGSGEATVIDVIDGDTIEVSIGGKAERVRLLGIDAPESVHPTVPVQCFGPEASAELKALLPAGTEVRVERDVESRDRYERLLLYVYRADDGLFVNQWLVSTGLADVVVYEPNSALAGALSTAKRAARSRPVGLWQHCDGPDQPLQ